MGLKIEWGKCHLPVVGWMGVVMGKCDLPVVFVRDRWWFLVVM